MGRFGASARAGRWEDGCQVWRAKEQAVGFLVAIPLLAGWIFALLGEKT